MYLKQMGQVPLLTREQEVEISKRIEQAEGKARLILCSLGFAGKEHLALAGKLLCDPPKERFERVIADKQAAGREELAPNPAPAGQGTSACSTSRRMPNTSPGRPHRKPPANVRGPPFRSWTSFNPEVARQVLLQQKGMRTNSSTTAGRRIRLSGGEAQRRQRFRRGGCFAATDMTFCLQQNPERLAEKALREACQARILTSACSTSRRMPNTPPGRPHRKPPANVRGPPFRSQPETPEVMLAKFCYKQKVIEEMSLVADNVHDKIHFSLFYLLQDLAARQPSPAQQAKSVFDRAEQQEKLASPGKILSACRRPVMSPPTTS